MPVLKVKKDDVWVDVFGVGEHTHAREDLEGVQSAPTLLWSGTWSSESITVEGLSEYSHILVKFPYNGGETAIVDVTGNWGGCLCGSASGQNIGVSYAIFAISGNTLTMGYCYWKNLGSGSSGTSNITAIYGFIKKSDVL